MELNTGEVAIVRMINHASPLQPRVILIYDREGVPFPKPVETDLKENTNRWIIGSKKSSELGQAQQYLTA